MNMPLYVNSSEIPVEYLQSLLKEDIPFGDITSESVVPDISCHAGITVEQDAVIAGTAEASALYRHNGVAAECRFTDGSVVHPGDEILTLQGKARTILTVERTALNIIGRMSGIATATRQYVDLVQTINPSCRIAATRKTCPGFRLLDKKAVMTGGGDPHRWSLSDAILIKDNHLSLVSLPDAVARAKSHSAYHVIEVEVSSSGDAILAAKAGADVIMFDNMSPSDVGIAIGKLRAEGLRDGLVIEVSGGINPDSVVRYAEQGADRISIGALTHSVKNVAAHLDIAKDS
jgi:nicotinate-nucleotide pyrophosphorylase (carboxylating)